MSGITDTFKQSNSNINPKHIIMVLFPKIIIITIGCDYNDSDCKIALEPIFIIIHRHLEFLGGMVSYTCVYICIIIDVDVTVN